MTQFVRSHVVLLGLSVRLSWYPMWSVSSSGWTMCSDMTRRRDVVGAVTVMCVLLFVLDVSMLREYEGDGNAGVGCGWHMWFRYCV